MLVKISKTIIPLQKRNQTSGQFSTVSFEKKQNSPVRRTIELGTFKDNDAIRKALASNGFMIEYWANDIFEKIPLGRHKKTKLNLVLISAGQLGFNDWVPYEDICERARELGLKLAPAEVGPQFRLQYKSQPENEWLHIAMVPITASDGDPTVFDVMHNDHHAHDDHETHSHHGLQLCSSSVHHDVLWSPSSHWIFATIN